MLGTFLKGAKGGGGNIEYVGGTTGFTGTTTSSWTVSLTSLTGGIDTQPAVGDFVIVFYSVATAGDAAARSLSVVTSGYTQQALLFANDTQETHFLCATSTLATAATSVTLSQTFGAVGVINVAGTAVVLVFRGVSASTPMDVSPVTNVRTNGATPLLQDITPVSSNAFVVGAGANATFTLGVSLSANVLGGFLTVAHADTGTSVASATGAGHIGPVPAGLTDPGNISSSSTATANSAAAITLALRPA